MAKIQTSRELGGLLCKVLGLPKTTVWFELRCEANCPAIVRCEYLPEALPRDEHGEFVTKIAEYQVVPRNDPA